MKILVLYLTATEEVRLRELLPEEADRLITSNDIIGELDSIVVSLFDDNDEPTDNSRKVERLMDDINWRLFHPDA